MDDDAVTGCFHNMDVYESVGHRVSDGTYLGRFFDMYPGRAEPDLSFAALLEMPVASGACLAMRRSAIPPSMHIPDTVFPDYFLQLLVARAGEIRKLDQPLANYRRHSNNSTPLPTRWHRLQHRTPDPGPLVKELLGYSDDADRALHAFQERKALRRAVEQGRALAWFRTSIAQVGLESTAKELARTYRRPSRFVLDKARHAHALVRRS